MVPVVKTLEKRVFNLQVTIEIQDMGNKKLTFTLNEKKIFH